MSKEFENRIKGEIGEKIIEYQLSKRNDAKSKIFHHLGVPCGEDIQEIDFIYITKQVVFVVESKNRAGLIKGNEDDENWISILPGRNHEFYSPIKQNATHIKFLRKLVDLKIPIYSLIIFPDYSNISEISIKNKFIRVIQVSYINNIIDSIICDVEYEMTDKKFENVCNRIEPYNEIDDETFKKHIETIKVNHFREGNDVKINQEFIIKNNNGFENKNNFNVEFDILKLFFFIILSIAILFFILYLYKHLHINVAYKYDNRYETESNNYTSNKNINNTIAKFIGWKQINENWYYYSSEGILVKNGCVQDNGKIYYMGSDGAMVKDRLIQVGNDFFYFGSDGAMIANSWDPSGQYYFGLYGKLEKNNIIQKDNAINNDYHKIDTQSKKFNIAFYKYFNEVYSKDEDYYTEKCHVSIIIPIFEENTMEDVSLNNAVKDAVYDIASDVEEEFNNADFDSFVLDKYLLKQANEDVVVIKLTGKRDYIDKVTYLIEYDRNNQEYTYWEE